VFHQSLDERLSLNVFSEEELKIWFIPYAVNEAKAGKEIIHLNGEHSIISSLPNVMNASARQPHLNNCLCEWNLPVHDEAFQKQGFMETSCFIHVLSNELFEGADYIGVCQYDMRWTNKSAKTLRSLIQAKSFDNPKSLSGIVKKFLGIEHFRNTVYAQISGELIDKNNNFHNMASTDHFNWDYLLVSYNKFFNTNWGFADLKGQPLSLWQTYLMPKDIFCELSQWLTSLVREVAPWANEPPYETHWGVLGGYTERAECLFMAIKNRAGEVHLKHLSLEHDDSISTKLNIFKGHYGVVDG
jgi:hypothetical protein